MPVTMKLSSDLVAREEPHTWERQPQSERTPTSTMFGFPVAVNQFSVLQSAEAQSQGPRSEGLVDPRTTRHQRQAAEQAGNREMMDTGGHSFAVNVENPAQDNFDHGTCVEPVAVENATQFIPYSFAASSSDILLQSGEPVHYMLESGAVNVDGGETLYSDLNCNKRISCAGPERSAGRPGHTPIRRILACDEHIEDRCAGQDWSAGRPGLTPFGASSAACMSSQTACIGPYGTAAQQQHYTGRNTREEQSFTVSTSPLTTELPRQEDSSTI